MYLWEAFREGGSYLCSMRYVVLLRGMPQRVGEDGEVQVRGSLLQYP